MRRKKRNTNWRRTQGHTQRHAQQAEEEKVRTLSATHEAGHCIADELYGPGVEYSTIEPSDGSDAERPLNLPPGWVGFSTGYTKMRREHKWVKREEVDILVELMCAMAGPLMEDIYARHAYGHGIDPGMFILELDGFWRTVSDANTPREMILAAEEIAQDRLLGAFRDQRVFDAWRKIADELLASGRVSGDRVREIIDAAGARKFVEERIEQANQA